MGLEAATYINQLVPSNPVGATDPKAQGDDHLRLIKQVLQNTFPNIDGVVNATDEQLNALIVLAGAITGLANPTSKVGPTVTNGVSTLAMRSDGAPAIDLTASYVWTGAHSFAQDKFTVFGQLFNGFTNPSVTVGLSVNGGSATTAMRSDAAPALDQAIAPTWTGLHTFSGGGGIDAVTLSGTNPVLRMTDTDAPANEKNWRILANSSSFRIGAVDDVLTTTIIAFEMVRVGTAISTINFPTGQLQYGGREVGFRGLETRLSSGSPDNLSSVDHGKAFYIQPGTTVLNLPAAALIGGVGLYTIVNNANAACSLVAGAGTDLTWYGGAGTPTAGTTRTLAGGGVATLSVVGTGWRLWGVGIS